MVCTVCVHCANSNASVRMPACTNHLHNDLAALKEPFVRASFPRTMHAPLGMIPTSNQPCNEDSWLVDTASQLLTLALTNHSETTVLSVSKSPVMFMTGNSAHPPFSGKCSVLNVLHARSKQGRESKGFSLITRLVPVSLCIIFQHCSKRHLTCWRSKSALTFQVTTRWTRSS